MRVGLLTTSFPRFSTDISGSFVLGFARALAQRGHAVEVLAPEPPDGPASQPGPEIAVQWVPYLRPRSLQRTFYGAGVPDNCRRDPRAWLGLPAYPAALTRAARRSVKQWDALVSHWALPSALCAGLVRGPRNHLAVFHSADLHALEQLPGRSVLARRIAQSATELLFVSRDHRKRFLRLLPSLTRARATARCHVSPMGIEDPTPPTAARSALRQRLGFHNFTLLSLGRLVPIKGVTDAIRAVALSNAELVVAGDGPERARLEQTAADLGARVRFLGLATGAAKADLLAAADAFIVPSRPIGHRAEGVPTALLEALAAGLPVIGTASGAIESVLEHERNGLIVPAGQPRSLRHAIDRLEADPDFRRRLAAAARRDGQGYRWSVLAPEIERLL